MFSPRLAIASLVLGLALTTTAVAAQTAPAAATAVSPADAAAFLGDWTLTMEGPQGPAAIALSIRDDAGKVVGEVSSQMIPKTAISDISKTGANLVLKYTLTFDGNAIPVAITLKPVQNAIGVNFAFGDGAFSMDGTAAKTAK